MTKTVKVRCNGKGRHRLEISEKRLERMVGKSIVEQARQSRGHLVVIPEMFCSQCNSSSR